MLREHTWIHTAIDTIKFDNKYPPLSVSLDRSAKSSQQSSYKGIYAQYWHTERTCVHARARARMRACVRVCVCVWLCVCLTHCGRIP